jgi:chemotaxis signal transduction protein
MFSLCFCIDPRGLVRMAVGFSAIMNNKASDTPSQYFEELSPEESVRTLQLIRSRSSQLAIFAEDIAAIVPWQEPTPLPHAPTSVLGVVCIQGRMLTVLDLAVLPAHEDTSDQQPHNASEHIIALRGDEQLALAVDTVGETLELNAGDSITKQGMKTRLVLGVLHREGAEITILNLKELFPAAIQGRERRRRRF